MRTELTSYRDGDLPLTGFFAWDDVREGKCPGVLVVHGGAGLDDHARRRTRRFAAAGFVAFACDLFGDGIIGERQRVIACLMELNRDPDRLCKRAQAGIDTLLSHPLIDGRLAAVGYCFGGMTVLQLARSGVAMAGMACIHGSLKTTRPAQAGAVKAGILVCHGALDPHVPMSDVMAFVEEMNSAGADWQLNIYGNARHGFTHEDAVRLQTPGVEYNPEADARSSAALHAFLTALFGQL